MGRCEKFRALTPQERRELLMKENRCYMCFQLGHNINKCKMNFTCKQCGAKHHTLLHGSRRLSPEITNTGLYNDGSEEDVASTADTEGAEEVVEFGYRLSSGEKVPVSLRTVPLWVGFGKKEFYVNALLDDGNTGSAMISSLLIMAAPVLPSSRRALT